MAHYPICLCKYCETLYHLLSSEVFSNLEREKVLDAPNSCRRFATAIAKVTVVCLNQSGSF